MQTNPGISESTLSVRKEFVAQLQGKEVYKVFLNNGKQSIIITNIGCSIVSIETPGKTGVCKNIVAGFSNIEDYLVNRDYFGCVVGRYANRIASGRFVLDGKQFQLPVNNDSNHLHGGIEGFHKKIWKIVDLMKLEDRVTVVFSYLSKDGEEGYPGNLKTTVTYSLNKQNQLTIEYAAETDKATPVNLTNHSYFNLTDFDVPVIDEHLLQVNASYYTEKKESNVPTGSILPVEGTPLDFNHLKQIGTDIDQYPQDMGFDHNLVLNNRNQENIFYAAKLYDPESGRILNVYTTQPGLQVYTANYWDGTIKGRQGDYYQKHGAIALETQSFPDSPNHPSFPNTILYPGKQYFSKTIYEFDFE